jgi:hypothetical protein
MKTKLAAGMVLALCGAACTFGADGTWTGYISDSHCGAKGARENHADCATKCAKEKGASYVFVNDADHQVYNLDAQEKVAEHAGHHVTLSGKADGDTIKIAKIEMAK